MIIENSNFVRYERMETRSSKLNHTIVQCIKNRNSESGDGNIIRRSNKNNSEVQKDNMALSSGYFTVST